MKNLYIIIFFITFLSAGINCSNAEDFYQWTDEDGVVHVTDNPEKVPSRYKSSTKVVKEKDTGYKSTVKKYWKSAKQNKKPILIVLGSLAGLYLLYKLIKALQNKSKTMSKNKFDEVLKRSGIDTMNIPQFKSYAKNLLSAKGYSVKEFEGDLDFGVDFVAEKGSSVHLVKVVADTMATSKMVVNDVLRDTSKYGCNSAMVISKNFFTEDAVEFSKSSPCELIDRNALGKWIKDCKLYN
jgi:HJR/Mrr/RecB family endonuclease